MLKETNYPQALINPSGQIIESNIPFNTICGLTDTKHLRCNVVSLSNSDDPKHILKSYQALKELANAGPTAPVEWRASLRAEKAVPNDAEYDIVVWRSPRIVDGTTVLEGTLTKRIDNSAKRKASPRSSSMYNRTMEENLPAKKHCVSHDAPPMQRISSVEADDICNDDYHNAAAKAVASVVSVRPKKVLIVDDALSSLKIMAKMVRRLGQEVDTAVNGQEALDLLHRSRYDLVFMDIFMPTMNGLEASTQFRKMERQNRNPFQGFQKLIAMSGESSPDICDEANSAGFDAFVPKPLTEKRFREVLASV